MLQPSMGGKAAVKKAPAGKSAKMLDSTEALNLRAKAAFDHNQRQEQRKPAAKRCVSSNQATAVRVYVCMCVCVCVCVCVCLFSNLPGLAGCTSVIPRGSTICTVALLQCNTAIPHCNMLA